MCGTTISSRTSTVALNRLKRLKWLNRRRAGRLVMPVGSVSGSQELVWLTREGQDDYRIESLCEVAFVPLLGEQGWPEP